MSSTKYDIFEGRESTEWDSSGRSITGWNTVSSPEESEHEPKEGQSFIYKYHGLWYEKTVVKVSFRGMVAEDTEGYDVEYRTRRLEDFVPGGMIAKGRFLFSALTENVLTGYMYEPSDDDMTMVIPEGVEGIADGAFEDVPYVKSFVLPSTLKSIGCGAFKNCEFDSITIPDSVIEIGSSAQ